MRDRLNAHVTAENAVCNNYSHEAFRTAVEASALLWIAPVLRLRTAGTCDESEALDAAGARKAMPSLRKAISCRLQLEEKGEWEALLTDYLK